MHIRRSIFDANVRQEEEPRPGCWWPSTGCSAAATTIATEGKHCGETVYIPRISLSPDDNDLPFKWSRRQFPVRVSFAMTINKSQGQTLRRVGVYLSHACFSHGQLYVAASRVGHPDHIRFAVDRDEATGEFRTRNVVWTEALTSTACS